MSLKVTLRQSFGLFDLYSWKTFPHFQNAWKKSRNKRKGLVILKKNMKKLFDFKLKEGTDKTPPLTLVPSQTGLKDPSFSSVIEFLLDLRMVTHDQIETVKIENKKTGTPLDTLLVEAGFVTENAMAEIKANVFECLVFNPDKHKPQADVLSRLSSQDAYTLKILPLSYNADKGIFHLVLCDPENLRIFDRVKELYGPIHQFVMCVSPPSVLMSALAHYYGRGRSLKELVLKGDLSFVEQSPKNLSSGVETAQGFFHPSVPNASHNFLDILFQDAVSCRASDIHFEPDSHSVQIRYRIDGLLQKVCTFHRDVWPSIVVQIKILSKLNLAESRLPQDGRFSKSILARTIDWRVSILPTQYGENIVLRILDRLTALKSLEALGFSQEETQRLQRLVHNPNGLMIMTGPTGSGKTTTLYALLQYLATSSLNIMTLEDPIEYALPCVRQTEIQEKIGFTFAEGIRSMLRQGPDILFVGEVRDEETARMAFRAAMLGHFVLTTLHTQDVFGVFGRLLDLGITSGFLDGTIRAILAQRLLRTLCPHCKQRSFFENHMVFKARGCSLCSETGYLGRTSIVEILEITDDLNHLVARQASLKEIRACSMEQKFSPLQKRALEKVFLGETSIDEIRRVLGSVSLP